MIVLDFAWMVLAALLAAPSVGTTAVEPALAQVADAPAEDGFGAALGEGEGAGPNGASGELPSAGRVQPQTCTYSTYSWSTEQGRAVDRRRVEKAYSEVVDDERSPENPLCTVCSEDQVTIDPSSFGVPLEPIGVCWVYAEEIEAALRAIAESGEFEFTELTGYRAGRTRGRVVDGVRTEWSNHSFGTAIDINADHNGLYRSCDVEAVTPETIGSCRLGVGGEWNPTRRPNRTVTRDSSVYSRFTEGVNWRWGGEIDGDTRDMMHFSITGY